MCHLTAYVCVYYDGQICNTNEGTTFVSNNTKTFMVDKVITFTQLLELVHQKLNIDPEQHIQHLHFRCPIFESGQRYMYTSFILRDDADVRQMFNIFYNNPSLPLSLPFQFPFISYHPHVIHSLLLLLTPFLCLSLLLHWIPFSPQ